MWGGRFQKAEERSALDFNASVSYDCRMYKEDIAGSLAHASMLADHGIISKEDLEKITGGLLKIKKEIDDIIKNKNIMDLNLPVKTTIPKLKTEDVESVNSILGQFSTAFNNETSRGSNIHVAGESSSDIIIMPQETYSYNNATGPRVLSKGYKYAPVIVGGKYINGEGGGVCQVSTTIYNAALLAGLEIVEVHNHTYLSHYVSGGRDATVAYGYYDLKFKNPYSHPIYIKNIVGKGSITSKIYGCRDDAQRIYVRTEHEYKKDKIIIKTYRVYLDKENKKIKEELISTNKYDNK